MLSCSLQKYCMRDLVRLSPMPTPCSSLQESRVRPARAEASGERCFSFLLARTSFAEQSSRPLFPLGLRMGTFPTASIRHPVGGGRVGKEKQSCSVLFVCFPIRGLSSPICQDSVSPGWRELAEPGITGGGGGRGAELTRPL